MTSSYASDQHQLHQTFHQQAEILHNHTEECTKDNCHIQLIKNRSETDLLDKKEILKKYHDQSHNAKPLPELNTGHKVLFLSPEEQNKYHSKEQSQPKHLPPEATT